MFELEPNAGSETLSLTPDCCYVFLPAISPRDDLMQANQSAPYLVPNSQQPTPGQTFPFYNGSRDLTGFTTSTVGLPSAAWGYPGFSYARNNLGDLGCHWVTNSTAIATSSTTPPDSQGWAGDWDPTFRSSFLPLNADPVNSINSTLHNPIDSSFGEVSIQSPSRLTAQPEGKENPGGVHGIHQTGQGIYCQQCNSQFCTRALLESHAREELHAPYRCRCGSTFSRLDVLRRHVQIFQPGVSYPCPHCKKHRGPRAFARLDHLTQHLRGYHNMESEVESEVAHSQQSSRKRKATFSCPHETCLHPSGMASLPDEPAMNRTFLTRGEYTRHLREVHNESLFPCVEIGCCRIGGRGFFRKKDLLNHVKEHHNDAEFQSSAS